MPSNCLFRSFWGLLLMHLVDKSLWENNVASKNIKKKLWTKDIWKSAEVTRIVRIIGGESTGKVHHCLNHNTSWLFAITRYKKGLCILGRRLPLLDRKSRLIWLENQTWKLVIKTSWWEGEVGELSLMDSGCLPKTISYSEDIWIES